MLRLLPGILLFHFLRSCFDQLHFPSTLFEYQVACAVNSDLDVDLRQDEFYYSLVSPHLALKLEYP